MLELLIKIFIGYSVIKMLYHFLIEGHHPKDIMRCMNNAGSTIIYKVIKKNRK